MRLRVGEQAPWFTARDIYGRWFSLGSYHGKGLLLSFNRAAVCPLCNIRTFYLIDRAQRYRQQGLEIVTFFESSPHRAYEFLNRLRAPFPIVGDLGRTVYAKYGLESSMLGTARGTMTRRSVYQEARQRGLGIWQLLRGFLAMDGNHFRMPADFLIGPDMTIQKVHYGRDSGDFLGFAELDAFAASLYRNSRLGRTLPPLPSYEPGVRATPRPENEPF
jgi:peroxiredoxin